LSISSAENLLANCRISGGFGAVLKAVRKGPAKRLCKEDLIAGARHQSNMQNAENTGCHQTRRKKSGVILEAIRKRIDEKWPKNARLAGSKGAQIEALYATLDAIKNPWRNATMHVEKTYAPHEALHIARCVGMFLVELMKHCDESGIPPHSSPAKASVGEGVANEALTSEATN
jgi:hypothetical protein